MHSPIKQQGKYSSFHGTYLPMNKEKYIGINKPKYKSKLEWRLMHYFDRNPAVLSWSYEQVIIPYYDPVRKQTRKYYVDFSATLNTGHGNIKKVLIEVKSKHETVEPVKTPRTSEKTYNQAKLTWLTNSSKWKTARQYAKNKGYEFVILTEDQLK